MLELLEKLQDETPLYGREWVVSPFKIVMDLLKHLDSSWPDEVAGAIVPIKHPAQICHPLVATKFIRVTEGDSADLFRRLIAAQPDRVFEAAKSEALSLIEEYSDNDCGFGSSDMTAAMMSTLNAAGCETTFAHGIGIIIKEIPIPH